MQETSTQILINDLRSYPGTEQLIKNAEANKYHEFKSSFPTPIIELVNDLQQAKLTELVVNAQRGKYDATDEESREWMKQHGSKLL